MITKIILAYFAILAAVIFCLFLVIELVVEIIKDIKGDTVGDRIKLLKDLGYEVEVENGTIFILLPKKDYNNRYFRKGIEEVMGDYPKSYGIRLKEKENETIKVGKTHNS